MIYTEINTIHKQKQKTILSYSRQKIKKKKNAKYINLELMYYRYNKKKNITKKMDLFRSFVEKKTVLWNVQQNKVHRKN